MKIKKGFELRDVCGENVIVASGVENIDFGKVICLNESAAYLWHAVEGKDFDAQTMADLLCKEYEVDKEVALADSTSMLKEWAEVGLVEE